MGGSEGLVRRRDPRRRQRNHRLGRRDRRFRLGRLLITLVGNAGKQPSKQR